MYYLDTLFRILVKPLFRKVTYPSLFELSQSGHVSTDVLEILSTLDYPSNAFDEHFQEFRELKKVLSLRVKEASLNYPETFNISDNSALLLYCIIRYLQPETVLETGIANGISSYYMLSALNKNGKGDLHSVDIDSNVGGLLRESERSRWRLHILNKKSARAQFKAVVASLPAIDIFIHDSDHSYNGQMSEYEAVYNKITGNGILFSDDIDFSYAFKDFSVRVKCNPSFLVTSTKVLGAINKRACQTSSL